MQNSEESVLYCNTAIGGDITRFPRGPQILQGFLAPRGPIVPGEDPPSIQSVVPSYPGGRVPKQGVGEYPLRGGCDGGQVREVVIETPTTGSSPDHLNKEVRSGQGG